jgi:hypothetical protein
LIEEHQAEYDAMLLQRASRSQHATAAACTRLQAWANTVEIDPFTWNRRKLEVATVEQHRSFRMIERDDLDPSFTLTDNAIIAYVRHNHTNYDDLIHEIEGQIGFWEAYAIIKTHVNALINERLPSPPAAVRAHRAHPTE